MGDINAAKAAVNGVLVAKNEAAMTDQTKAYIYANTSPESGMTNGDWYYYNGSAWVSGGSYQGTVPTVDDTLTIPDAAADAQVTGNKIINLENNLKEGNWYNFLPI